MKDQRKMEIKVGLTVLAGVSILLFGLSIFKEWNVGTKQTSISIRFPSSAGLQVGDEVAVNGVKSGKVYAVDLQKNAVLVQAFIQDGVWINKDAHAKIQMLELMGGKKVEITLGQSTERFTSTDVMRGLVDPDIAGALGMVGELGGDVTTLAGKAGQLMDNTNTIIGDPQFVAALRDAIVNLKTASGDLRSMLSDNRNNVKEIAATVVTLTRRVDTLLTETRPMMNRLVRRSERVLGTADTLLTDIHSFLTEIRMSNGIVNKALHDSTLNRRIDVLVAKLDSLSSIIIDGQLRIKLRL